MNSESKNHHPPIGGSLPILGKAFLQSEKPDLLSEFIGIEKISF